MASGFQYIYTHRKPGDEKHHYEPRAEMAPRRNEMRINVLVPAVITAVLLIGTLAATSALRLLANMYIDSLITPLDLPTSRSTSADRPPASANRVASDMAMNSA